MLNEKNIESTVENYLFCESGIQKAEFENNENKDECFKTTLDTIFGCEINCKLYDQVVNGQGNEKNKIRSPYSSSLQSLLFFSQICSENPITINLNSEKPIVFERVLFEYKNKVIGYPSSVDVVLADKDHKNILFIESKLAEIARDSTDKSTNREVGISYYTDNKSGYYKALLLERDELERIGIEVPDEYPIKDTKGKPGAYINPLPGRKYVYSYGIKQMLSHIIGILNFSKHDFDQRCSIELDEYADTANLYFMELWNDFPTGKINSNENIEMIRKIQEDYKKHVEKVESVLKEKNLNISMLHTTYQDLYKNRGKYKLPEKVIRYYHLAD